MTSAEYVSQVNRLMDLQNNYFTIFIAILAITLGFLGILQWRITDKQIDKIKNEIHESVYNQYRTDLELTNSKIRKEHSDSLRVITFSAIDTIMMTELRIYEAPKKITTMLKLIAELDSIDDEETLLLGSCMGRMLRLLQQKNILENSRDMNTDCTVAYPYLKEIMIFIETKSDKSFLEESRFDDVILNEFLEFEIKYNPDGKNNYGME